MPELLIQSRKEESLGVKEVQARFDAIVARNSKLVGSLECTGVQFNKQTGKAHIYFLISYKSAGPSEKFLKPLFEKEIYGEIEKLASRYGGFGKTPVPSNDMFYPEAAFKKVLFIHSNASPDSWDAAFYVKMDAGKTPGRSVAKGFFE